MPEDDQSEHGPEQSIEELTELYIDFFEAAGQTYLWRTLIWRLGVLCSLKKHYAKMLLETKSNAAYSLNKYMLVETKANPIRGVSI